MKKIILFLVLNFVLFAQEPVLNRQMEAEGPKMTQKVLLEESKSCILVHSDVQNLTFDSNQLIDKVVTLTGGDWEVWLPAGTHILKIDAPGFKRLELNPFNFTRKKIYELNIKASGFSSSQRSDENLIEIVFQCSVDSVYSSYGDFTPTLSKSELISYKLPAGEYKFVFKKRGYADENKTVDVRSARSIPVTLAKGSSTQSGLALQGFLTVTSEPLNCEVILNGQKIGSTPLQQEIVPGKHQLEIRKNLYHSDISSFTVESNKNQSLTIKLKPKFGFLSIDGAIPGSKIFIDGKLLESRNVTEMELESMVAHQVRIEADLYHPQPEDFSLTDGEKKVITANLKPAFGSLAVTSIPEDGAEVFLDGKKVGLTPYTQEKLGSGKYTLKVTKALFSEVEESITITDGMPFTKNALLNKNFAELEVISEGSSIFINGTLSGTDQVSKKVPAGKYTVSAEKGDRYSTKTEEVYLVVGDKRSIKLEPEPKLGSLSVIVEPVEAGNAAIFIDGDLQGEAPKVIPLLIGQHTVKLQKFNYLDVTQTVSIKDNEKIPLRVTMMTYSGSRQQTKDSWGLVKWISAGSAVAAGGTALYFNSSSKKNYNSFNTAANVSDAAAFKDKSTSHQKIANAALYTAGAALSSALISWIVQAAL